MKRFFSLLLLCLVYKAAVLAVPAYPHGHKVRQPDGSLIEIFAHGDEFSHILTMSDGTVVAKGVDGYYRPTGEGTLQTLSRQRVRTKSASGPVRIQGRHRAVNSRNFRGLVLLVSFSDQNFSLSDNKIHDYFDKIMNAPDLKSYNPGLFALTRMTLTGSVYDYFRDNSNGLFTPQFDVVGPIRMDVSKFYVNGVSRTAELTEMILRKADQQGVDFTRYDSDGDGEIDMIYLMYAGYSSNYQDNDTRLIWPHASTMDEATTGLPAPVLDGKRVGRYACSAEIFGWHDDGDTALDGIGTIVHEFSHVLGFQDHYDSTNGYQEHPNTWDVMSAGSYSEDFNRTPCGFNSYEKHEAGFCEPLDITDKVGQSVTLASSETSDQACLIRSYQNHVSYFMENRQADKWDRNLPGHGLLVWRVDSIRPEYWKYNYVNVTTRACFRLVRACGTQGSFLTGVEDTDFDSFPGTHHVTELDNDDDAANLVSFDGYPCPVVLRNITENAGIIGFDVEADSLAENRPITYQIPATLYVSAQKLVGDEWIPVQWTMNCDSVDGKPVLTNFLPDTENYRVSFSYSEDGQHTVTINAQRMEKTTDYGRWLCNFTNVDEQGAGVMSFTVGRYGVPHFDPSLEVGLCSMKPTAYVVAQKNILSRDAVYRNIQFTDVQSTGIWSVPAASSKSDVRGVKVLRDGRILIRREGCYYDITGRRVN